MTALKIKLEIQLSSFCNTGTGHLSIEGNNGNNDTLPLIS